jgi:hypothetical protein
VDAPQSVMTEMEKFHLLQNLTGPKNFWISQTATLATGIYRSTAPLPLDPA